MRGKLIVVEGTDCSGKETQTNLLMDKLRQRQIRVEKFAFPNYTSPTGKIIGGPYLGKENICKGWFPEGASKVDPMVSSLYYAADRKYNIHKIELLLENGVNVILDRYVYSNMAHQGGKIELKDQRYYMYEWLETLEFKLLGLPTADVKIFLHMPYKYSKMLQQYRNEAPDEHETSETHLENAEKAYLEIADKYKFKTIECVDGNNIRTINSINEDIMSYITSEGHLPSVND